MGLNAKELDAAKNEYALVCRIEGKSGKTIEHYESVIKLFTRSLGAEELTPGTVRSFLAGLLGDHKITTVSCYCRALRSFCHFLLREGLIDEDPMRDIKTPKAPRKYPYVLSEEEIAELLSAARRNARDYAIVLFLLDTGVRASELTGLHVDDVDFSTMSAKVFGKGGKSRTVFFSHTTARALARWKSKRPDIAHEHAFFLSQRRAELTVAGLRQMLKRLQARTAVKDKKVCPHVLRHCFATIYAKEGGDSHSLACLMGHTSTKMGRSMSTWREETLPGAIAGGRRSRSLKAKGGAEADNVDNRWWRASPGTSPRRSTGASLSTSSAMSWRGWTSGLRGS